MNWQNRKLKRRLRHEAAVAGSTVDLRTGVIVSVSTGTATVKIGGVNIANIPYHAHVTALTAGDNVDVLYDGPAPRIIGKF